MAKQIYHVHLQDLIKRNRKKRVLTCHRGPTGWEVSTAQFLPDGESHVLLFENRRASYATYPHHWTNWSTKKVPALID